MKVAIVHYWLVGMRGGEKVLESLCEMYPEADIYTLVLDREKISQKILRHRIQTSFLQKMGGRRHYQMMLPLMPFALESFDLTDYDLVISSEAGPAKGVITRPDAVHICYCHSPMRYLWDLSHQYRQSAGVLKRLAMTMTSPALRLWDVTTSTRVDHFIANSAFVAKRIEKYYRRPSTVVHPPVATERFELSETIDDYFLCAGQVTPYKRLDVAIEAFGRLGLPLVVAGSGITPKMKADAGPTIRFIDEPTDAEMARLLQRCRALIYPGVEDFGIIPVEAMLSGRPVIALGRGGVLETVVANKSGLFFEEQTAESLENAVRLFQSSFDAFDPHWIRQHAMQFGQKRFVAEMMNQITRATRSPVRLAEPEVYPRAIKSV